MILQIDTLLALLELLSSSKHGTVVMFSLICLNMKKFVEKLQF